MRMKDKREFAERPSRKDQPPANHVLNAANVLAALLLSATPSLLCGTDRHHLGSLCRMIVLWQEDNLSTAYGYFYGWSKSTLVCVGGVLPFDEVRSEGSLLVVPLFLTH